MPKRHLLLYGTAGCHLCAEAEALLREAAAGNPGTLEWQAVDIAGDDGLGDRYGIRIPVLHCRESGAELGWPFDAAGLREFLRRPGRDS